MQQIRIFVEGMDAAIGTSPIALTEADNSFVRYTGRDPRTGRRSIRIFP